MKIKICGITNHEDAQVAAEAGADLLGFILYPKSPRYIAPAEVGPIVAAIREQFAAHDAATDDAAPRPAFVGVFVNEPLARIQAILAETGLDAVVLRYVVYVLLYIIGFEHSVGSSMNKQTV